ncbi:MAG: hypothetical protein HC778_00745 [Chamaesiphon sp. CSU_1_12]|nr:hypothetical protein [Chamaesiphon sp. CSU_1_12]
MLIKSPRMLVVERSPLFAFDRKISRSSEKLDIVGVFDKQVHKDREKYGTGQSYEVLLLDAHNNPVHEVPLNSSAKVQPKQPLAYIGNN